MGYKSKSIMFITRQSQVSAIKSILFSNYVNIRFSEEFLDLPKYTCLPLTIHNHDTYYVSQKSHGNFNAEKYEELHNIMII